MTLDATAHSGRIPGKIRNRRRLPVSPAVPPSGRCWKNAGLQRLNTVGGSAPATGRSVTADLGRQAFVPYRAEYFFYKKINGNVEIN
jgi:hypothetical protein